jgi:type IV secretion system protein VirD4
MTPNANVAAWRTSTEPSWRGIALKVLAVGVIALLASQYLAGYLFLWWFRADPRQATPLTVARYAYYYGDREQVRRRALLASLMGLAVVGACGGVLLLPQRRSLHGEARFARRSEISRAGLFAKHGIFLGRYGRRSLILSGQQGVLLSAPPRSGKGVGVVVPNLLLWQDSVVVTDIKKENWTLTAGYRKSRGQEVHLFDPLAEDRRTAHWNPFFYVSPDPVLRISGIQRIAGMFYPDPPGVDPFWTASARSLFLGISLYLFETPNSPRTIGEVLRQGMANDDEGFGAHWKRVIEGRKSGSMPLSSQCVRALCDVIDLAPTTASSIRKTFTSRLDLWLNPILDEATATNDFDLRELRMRPMSVYVGVNPDDLERLKPLLNLFFEQAIGLQTRELPEHHHKLKLQVLMLLDEFASMGRIPVIANAVAFLPGYNVRVLIVIQTPSQLRDVYGHDAADTIQKALATRIVYAPKDFSDAEEISKELGNTTVKARSLSKPSIGFDSKGKRQRSVNVSEQRRALLLPQEVQQIGRERQIVFYEGLRPMLCYKSRYYRERVFRKRLLPPPERGVSPPTATPAKGKPEARGAVAATPEIIDDSFSKAAKPTRIRKGKRRAGKRVGEPTGKDPGKHRTREATVADIDRIETLTLDDFDADFSQVAIPDTDRLSERDLQLAAASFLSALREK